MRRASERESDPVERFSGRRAFAFSAIGRHDRFVASLAGEGIAVFGPGAAAARLEGSKAFCREIAEAAGVPMARGRAFDDKKNWF